MMTTITNDTILSDTRTPQELVEPLINKLVEEKVIYRNSIYTLTTHQINPAHYELNAAGLLDGGRMQTPMYDAIVLNVVPFSLLDNEEVTDEDETEYLLSSVQELAELYAEAIAPDDFVQGEFGANIIVDNITEHGLLNTPLIVVHTDTSQASGFIPLVRAIRARQIELDIPEVRVYVHEGSKSTLREFQELPVRLRRV